VKIKLSGWQRLWVVLSIIYLPIVVLLLLEEWPNKKQIEHLWVYSIIGASIDASKDDDYRTNRVREAYKDISDRELIQKINAKYDKKPKYKEKLNKINLRYQKKIQSLGKDRLIKIGMAFIGWSIPIGILYLMGLAIGWIYKGFKEK